MVTSGKKTQSMLRHNMPRLETAISSPGKVLKEVMLPISGMVRIVGLESRLCNDAFDVPSAHQQAPTPLAIDWDKISWHSRHSVLSVAYLGYFQSRLLRRCCLEFVRGLGVVRTVVSASAPPPSYAARSSPQSKATRYRTTCFRV